MTFFENNPYLFAAAILTTLNTVILALLTWRFARYQRRQKMLLAGEGVDNLQDLVLSHKKALAAQKKTLKELGEILAEIVERNRDNIQKTGVVRYNPFPDSGGNMSFALALLDGQDNGIVISSLHSREGTRIYAKPIANGQSQYHLSDEEKQAIAEAQGNDH